MLIGQGADSSSIAKAVDLLASGELVSFPTETVYGLGADATNLDALKRLYAAKGRPNDHPVIVHIWSFDQIDEWAKDVPSILEPLAESLWPGPLTVVLRRKPGVLDQVTGGQDTVALRMPSHPVALALLKAFGKGLAAPSANRFGRLSPTRAEDVGREFEAEVSMVLDGGPCSVGIESTILDLSGHSPRILRPGMILPEKIEEIVRMSVPGNLTSQSVDVRVPGGLPAHYAPSTPLLLLPVEKMHDAVANLISGGKKVSVLSFQAPPQSPHVVWLRAQSDAPAYARELYGNLRRADAAETDYIVVEQPPEGAAWAGVNDRLQRASSK